MKLPADKFGDWEKSSFAPEACYGEIRSFRRVFLGDLCINGPAIQEAFLGKLKGIDGISTVETQTYTLEEALQ